MANIRIPLPRVPVWLTRALDRYSEWAEQPTGPTLWCYTVLRRDWVSITLITIISASFAQLTGSWQGFVMGIGAGVFSWVMVEMCTRE